MRYNRWTLTRNHCIFFFQAEDGIRDGRVTGVQTCALPIYYGPQWFAGGVFIGAGPWFHGFHRRSFYGPRGFEGRFHGDFDRDGFRGRGFAHEGFVGRGFARGEVHGGGGFHGFHGGGFHGGGHGGHRERN